MKNILELLKKKREEEQYGLKDFQDSFLKDIDSAYMKMEALPSHDQWAGLDMEDVVLLQRQKSFREGYDSAYMDIILLIEDYCEKR